MFVIGLTGGVGTGKSTVAKMFEQMGAVVLDADKISHELIEPKRLAWRQIIRIFGQGILNDDDTINRRKLASIVFKDEASRKRLEQIIHPKVMRFIKQQLHRLRRVRRTKAVVLDVPLLIEAGASKLADALVVVVASPEVQGRRLCDKYGWTEEEIRLRIDAQMEIEAKAALADYTVDNSDGVDATRKQVKRIWNQLLVAPRRS